MGSTARTNTCLSLRICFCTALLHAARHTLRKISHTASDDDVCFTGSKRFECTHRRPTDRPAIQSQYIDWLLIWFLAFDILNGSCFVFIHLVFQTPKLQRVWTASTYSLHTLSIESNPKYEQLIWRNVCTICTHSTKLPAICIWCTVRTLSFSLDLLLRSFFWACFFSWTKFMCIEQIVCLFRWTIIDFGVRECVFIYVYDWYDLIEKHRNKP